MKIALGADHAGFALKDHLRRHLEAHGHAVSDLGTHSTESTDYPDHAAAVGRAVASGEAERGLLVCGTGVGMAMAANKVRGVRAANCNNLFTARLARAHNDANVLTLGAREVAPEHAAAILDAFLATPFEGGRHARRIQKIADLE
jgi:ribose 5-phosphate isomerase B